MLSADCEYRAMAPRYACAGEWMAGALRRVEPGCNLATRKGTPGVGPLKLVKTMHQQDARKRVCERGMQMQ